MNFTHVRSSCRLGQSNYLHRIPRIPPYQTTPFTIDPSARSTQTFAQRYGVTPPHSPIDDPYGGNDYNGIEKDVSAGKTTVIKDTTLTDGGDQLNSKRFLHSSTPFDAELIVVSQKVPVTFIYLLCFFFQSNHDKNTHLWATTCFSSSYLRLVYVNVACNYLLCHNWVM